MNFECENCGKVFKRKNNLEYHVNNSVCIAKEHICIYCNSRFTTKTAMYNHIRNVCKMKKQSEIEKNEIYERLIELEKNNKILEEQNNKILEEHNKKIINLEKENKLLRKKIDKIDKNKIINNYTNNNINNGTINNITLI